MDMDIKNDIVVYDNDNEINETVAKIEPFREIRSVDDDIKLKLYESIFSTAGKLKCEKEELEKLRRKLPFDRVEWKERHWLKDGTKTKVKVPYIEWSYIVETLNQVFGTEWAIVEEYLKREGNLLVGKYHLFVRGCYVKTAYGASEYFENNKMQLWDDVAEGAQTMGLRRAASKSALGIGMSIYSQTYRKELEEYMKNKTENKDDKQQLQKRKKSFQLSERAKTMWNIIQSFDEDIIKDIKFNIIELLNQGRNMQEVEEYMESAINLLKENENNISNNEVFEE